MRPKSMPSALKTSTLPPLPPNKTLIQVFADFFAYLLSCAEKFIKETHATVVKRWDDLLNNAIFIIGHPNGWEGTQQSMLRKAAILGRLAPDTPEGRARVKFVSEGEASLHFCLREGVVDKVRLCLNQPSNKLITYYFVKDKKGFIIADLGGGTLDFSAYQVTGVRPLQAEEVAASICHLEGSTLVTLRAEGYITRTFLIMIIVPTNYPTCIYEQTSSGTLYMAPKSMSSKSRSVSMNLRRRHSELRMMSVLFLSGR